MGRGTPLTISTEIIYTIPSTILEGVCPIIFQGIFQGDSSRNFTWSFTKDFPINSSWGFFEVSLRIFPQRYLQKITTDFSFNFFRVSFRNCVYCCGRHASLAWPS